MRFSGAGGARSGGAELVGIQLPRRMQRTQGNGVLRSPTTARAAQCQPRAAAHALHAGTRAVCAPILPFLGGMSAFGDSKASQPHLSHGSAPRNCPSLQPSQGWGKGMAAAPHHPPSSPTAKHRPSTGSKPVSASSELLQWKAWTQLCPKWLHVPQHSPGQGPAHQTRLQHSVTLRTASPKTFPKSHLPTVPGSCFLGQTELTLVGTAYHPKITQGFLHCGPDPFPHLSAQL